MNYQEFLDYIYKRHSGNVRLGLERMEAILKEMDEPNNKISGIHIAGTNGKGSTAAMCEAICKEHGLKTGLNTSPHLVDYRERIRINCQNVKLKELMQTYKKWEDVFEKYEASFFEITTAMAFWLFYKHNIEASIFEVGLGGRLDGTKPFNSAVTVITSISYDHTKSLGNKIEKIAFEKAGILKQTIPVVLGKMPDEAYRVISEIASQKNIPIWNFQNNFKVQNVSIDSKGTHLDYSDEETTLKDLKLNLIGKHQANNAALAITASKLFLKNIGILPNSNKIRIALQKTDWLGRMQILQHNPLVL
ncbi:MAG: Mur ligase family protein, partial [Candidatus Cloacimonadota bacterium]|nr:Mur ligase family protein [Candidatus Cloacimonadota bacterium]